MTLVLIGKDLVLEGSRLKIEDKQVPGRSIFFSENLKHGSQADAIPNQLRPFADHLVSGKVCKPNCSFARRDTHQLEP